MGISKSGVCGMTIDFLLINRRVVHLYQFTIPKLTSCGEEIEMVSLQITDPEIVIPMPNEPIAVTVEYHFPNPFDAYFYLLENYKEEEIV